MQPHDPGVGTGVVDGDDVLEGHARRVVELDAGRAQLQQLRLDQRRGPHDDVRSGQPVGGAQGQQVGGTRAGAHERDHDARRFGGVESFGAAPPAGSSGPSPGASSATMGLAVREDVGPPGWDGWVRLRTGGTTTVAR